MPVQAKGIVAMTMQSMLSPLLHESDCPRDAAKGVGKNPTTTLALSGASREAA